MKLRKTLAIFLALIFVMALFAACGNGDSGTAPATGGETGSSPGSSGSTGGADTPAGPERSRIVNIGFAGIPRTLDPHNITNGQTETNLKMNYESLIYTPRTATGYEPMLAADWYEDPDAMYWIFYLREGVFWHNGDPFTADDVIYSLDRVWDNQEELAFVSQYNMQVLDTWEKLDEFTVRVNFTEPFPLAGNVWRAFYIVPKLAHEEHGEDLFNLQLCYGTGPWILNEFVHGQYSHFYKNHNYWNKDFYDPYFEEVFIHYVTEPASAVAAHLAGDLDIYAPSGGINSDMLILYSGTEDRIGMVDVNTNFSAYLGFQFKDNSFFNDVNARRAFSLAIDRQLIIDAVFGGFGILPTAFLGPGVIGFDPAIPPQEYNPDLARELLAQSSYDGRPLEIITNAGIPNGQQVLLAIQDMVNGVGFNLTTVSVEDTAVFEERRRGSDYDLYYMHTSFIDGLPARQMNLWRNDVDRQNFVHEEMFDIIEEYNQATDPAVREELARQINWIVYNETTPQLVITHYIATFARDWGVIGRDMFYPDGSFTFCYVDYDPSLVP